MRTLLLPTPPLRLLVDAAVFPGFRWCAPSTLTVRLPDGPLADGPPPSARNPPGLAFLFRAPVATAGPIADLPKEYGYLHVGDLATEHEWALAPWGIDAATDGLPEGGAAPTDVLLLAARTAESLFWGLHDWVHFHHFGPFERVAETELQCDLGALTWLLEGAAAVALSGASELPLLRAVAALTASRFDAEGRPHPPVLGGLHEALAAADPRGAAKRYLRETCLDGRAAT